MYVGTAPVTNGIAAVTLDGLICGITYNIIASGTLNGDSIGSRLFNETNDANHRLCPPGITATIPTTVSVTGKRK